MANHASHAALPYPIKGARFTVLVPLLDADGDPTAQTTPDTEISEDNAAATDATEEVSATSGMDGMGMLTFTGAETDCSCLAANFKAASGPKATLMTLYPRVLASVGTGTLSAGSAGGGTLGTLLAFDVTGCFVKTTGGTGGGGAGGANNQVRRMITYNTSTGAFTVAPNWETTPDNTTTYDVLLPEGVTLGMLKALNPSTPGRSLVVDASGLADATMVKAGPTGSGTAITARDIGASVLLSSGTGTGQVSLSSGLVDITQGAADKVWSSATRTLSAFSTALAVSVWDVLASAVATASSIGLQVKTNLDALVSTRATPAQILTTPANLLATDGTGRVTVGTNADKAGYALASTGLDAISTTDVTNDTDARSSFPKMVRALFGRFFNEVRQTTTQQTVRNDAGTVVSTMTVSDDGVTQTKAKSA